MISKVYNYSDEEFIQIVQSSQNFTDCSRKIGLSIYGSNSRKQIKKRCEELGISYQHFYDDAARKRVAGNKPTYTMEEILVENSTYTNRAKLKERLVRDNLIEYKCAICGNEGFWNGQPLSLQLDHINGINNDNRLENLRLLCPNCHAQTDTFSGKNVK